ncbi:hypothetical protein CYG48_12755 [Neorhizobium sp. SOG26]|uniref:glycosyltransferase n=1 Tax=Neorhizobium sp. SOG26 TaxID=2060726 RepID=UPI000E59550D|nr:glycosyltransferase [Neorhizobium sp. SOG26]AXV16481.1 hypothetical protein CYG48_12755 [Neorhizobium sp. SOG26]
MMGRVSQDDIKLVKASGLFDEQWYLEKYRDVAMLGMDPVEHYLWLGWKLGRDPSLKFSTAQYLLTNPDVGRSAMNPLLHFLRHGKNEGRTAGEETVVRTSWSKSKRVAIFASFSAKGKIEDYVKTYLRHLSDVCERVVVVCDNDLRGEDMVFLTGRGYHVITGRHGEYDFGSFKRGISLAREQGLLDQADELILCNDSCYAVKDFSDVFREMGGRGIDFWGITQNDEFRPHIQSFFVSFSRRVFNHPSFAAFFSAVEAKPDVSQVVLSYETRMTAYFNALGFTWDTFINAKTPGYLAHVNTKKNITQRPLFLLDSGCPLVKVKALNKPFANHDGIRSTFAAVGKINSFSQSEILQHLEDLKGIIDASNDIMFSLVMPFYNRSTVIRRAIDSVLSQTHQSFELILVDDGSDDGTADMVRDAYKSEIERGRLILLDSEGRKGVSAARNRGLARATSPWIGYVDSDNLIVPEFLEVFSLLIQAHPKHQFFYCWHRNVSTGEIGGGHYNRAQLLDGNFIDLGAIVHSRKLFEQRGGFDESLKRLVDWDLIIRYTHELQPVCIGAPMLLYSDDQSDASRISVRESMDDARIAIRRKYKMHFRVTTIIPTYNHERFIEAAIESAVAQTGHIVHTVLVYDDGSTDGTRDIIKKMVEKYPKIVRDISRGDNRGISETFKYCIKKAVGDFTAILEGDDVWTDNEKIWKQINFLLENPQCSMVFSKILVKELPSGKERTLERQEKLVKSILDGGDFLAEPTMNLIANFSSCLFKGALLRSVPERLFEGRFNEIALAFFMERHGPIGFLNEALSIYHQHPQGVWTGSSKAEQLRSGRRTREMVMDVARDIYQPAIADIIHSRYRPRLEAAS